MTLIMTYVLYLRETQYYVIPNDAQAATQGSKVYAVPPGSPGIPSILNTHYTGSQYTHLGFKRFLNKLSSIFRDTEL